MTEILLQFVATTNAVDKKTLFSGLVVLFTLKCLSIGTPKTINFPFVSNGKLMVFRCPNIQAHYNEAVIYLNFGTPKNDEFSIWNKWKIYYFQVSQYLSTLGYANYAKGKHHFLMRPNFSFLFLFCVQCEQKISKTSSYIIIKRLRIKEISNEYKYFGPVNTH